jgi:hypothetical protein
MSSIWRLCPVCLYNNNFTHSDADQFIFYYLLTNENMCYNSSKIWYEIIMKINSCAKSAWYARRQHSYNICKDFLSHNSWMKNLNFTNSCTINMNWNIYTIFIQLKTTFFWEIIDGLTVCILYGEISNFHSRVMGLYSSNCRWFFVCHTVDWEPLDQFTSNFAQLLELMVLRSVYFMVKFRIFIPE